MAAVFSSVSKKVDNAELTAVNAILDTTRTENDRVFATDEAGAAISKENSNINRWLPFFNNLSELLKNGSRDGTIRSPAQYSQTYAEIAKGIEAFFP